MMSPLNIVTWVAIAIMAMVFWAAIVVYVLKPRVPSDDNAVDQASDHSTNIILRVWGMAKGMNGNQEDGNHGGA